MAGTTAPPRPSPPRLADLIATWPERSGQPFAELARRVGVTRQQVQHWRHQARQQPIQAHQVAALAAALGVPVERVELAVLADVADALGYQVADRLTATRNGTNGTGTAPAAHRGNGHG